MGIGSREGRPGVSISMKATLEVQQPTRAGTIPDFCGGIMYFADSLPGEDRYSTEPVLAPGQSALQDPSDPDAAWQTMLAADTLRYLTLQITGSKASGHPGGFSSWAEAYAGLFMLGYKDIITEVGHHAPGFYSGMFMDRSLEEMGIRNVHDLMKRFREKDGLLGHLSGAVPGMLAPAGPLGQGQHFALAAAYLHPNRLFPLTIGDGGMGEPYVLSALMHFHTAFPEITNFLPVLVWNGYSQEHHSMVSLFTNDQMANFWMSHSFEEVVLVDAKSFDDADQKSDYVDSTLFSLDQRVRFTQAILEGLKKAAESALSGRLTVFMVKQLKGAGMYAYGAKSHNLTAKDTLQSAHILNALQKRAMHPLAFQIARDNLSRAGGGPASKVVVTESVLPLKELPPLPRKEIPRGEKAIPSTAMGELVAAVGRADPRYLVTNADGNEASMMINVNEAMGIRHPTADPVYHQRPDGRVYEPISEDACAGLAGAIALLGGRALWLSYESFVPNGLPILQTATQAMAELRRKTPSIVCMFTAGALEQGRNGWTHQRPEVESYFMALMKNGNVYPVFPCDANTIQIAYEWAIQTHNRCIAIVASKSSLPVYTTFAQAREAVEQGATILYESKKPGRRMVVFAAVGDMILLPVFEAKDKLEERGVNVRIVSVVNLRRLARPGDVAWEGAAQPDGQFMSDDQFNRLMTGDLVMAVTGSVSAVLESIIFRTLPQKCEARFWKRGDTAGTPNELFELNQLTARHLAARAEELLAPV